MISEDQTTCCDCPACGEPLTVAESTTKKWVAFCEFHMKISTTGETKSQAIFNFNEKYWGNFLEEELSDEDEE